MARPKTRIGPVKELRVVLSPEAYARIIVQAKQLDQTPASFARQIVMEKVVALEMAGSGTTSNALIKSFTTQMVEMGKEMEEKLK